MKAVYLIILLSFFVIPYTECFPSMFSYEARELFRDQDVNYRANWSTLGENDQERVRNLLSILLESDEGREILIETKRKAARSGETIYDIINVGSSSLTDTTLTRKFSPDSPTHVIYQTKSLVYINRNLNIKYAILDLAHELTHYLYREPFNPYKDSFEKNSFIVSTISGRGGEVDAYLAECRVLKDLFSKRDLRNSNCSQIIDHNSGEFSREVAIIQFFKVGKYFKDFISKTDETFIGKVSDSAPIFISSAYGVPYPIAAIKEFEGITKKVCLNDKRRLDIMREKLRRTIASSDTGLLAKYRLAKRVHISKCY